MSQITPACIWQLDAELAEGPVWHDGALWLVDIKGRKLHRCDEHGAQRQSWDAPGQIGFALPMADGGMVCGLPGRLMRFTPASGQFAPLLELEQHLPGNRLNDGYVDPRGRLWFGSMDDAETAPSGSLYRYDGVHAPQREDCGYVITNGPALSPDGRTFYHTDTLEKILYAYDIAADGSLSKRRRLIEFTGSGHPDGTVVDAEGHLWVGLFGGARAERYTPQGELAQTVAFPCPNITKLAFGGADLRTVFATTAWKGLSQQQRQDQALAGSIFSFRSDTPGQPQHQFNRNIT